MDFKNIQSRYLTYILLCLLIIIGIIVIFSYNLNKESRSPYSQAEVNVSPTITPTPPIAVMEAESGTITAPFVVSSPPAPIYVYQPNPNPTIDPSQGGRATYNFLVPAPTGSPPRGSERFIVRAVVNVQEPNATSAVYVNIDGEPTDATMLWDIPATTGFQNRYVSWRGIGLPGSNKFVPKAFSLTAGQHSLTIRGQQGNVKLDQVIVEEYACLADINHDGLVSISDYNSITGQFGQCQAGLSGDLNGDGCVTGQDFNIYKTSFGMVCRRNLPQPTIPATPTLPLSATPTRTPTPTPIAVLPSPICAPNETQYWSPPAQGALNCPIFSADNYWNRTITDLPLNSLSQQMITRLSNIGTPAGRTYVGFGSGLYQNGLYGIPVNIVPTNQPMVSMNFTPYGSESDPGPYPFPTNVGIQDMPNDTGDRHAIVIQNGTCNIYETYHTQHNGSGYTAGSGAKWNMSDPNQPLRHIGYTSADAAGLSVFAGLIRYDEVYAAMQQSGGMIHHALRFATDNAIIRANSYPSPYIWPARHSGAGQLSAPDSLPFGIRLRLKSTVNIETGSWSPQMKVILRTLRNYGLVLADGTSDAAIGLDGLPDCRWNDPGMWNNGDPGNTGDNYAMNQEFLNLQANMFEVVDTSGIIIDPNSGRSRQP